MERAFSKGLKLIGLLACDINRSSYRISVTGGMNHTHTPITPPHPQRDTHHIKNDELTARYQPYPKRVRFLLLKAPRYRKMPGVFLLASGALSLCVSGDTAHIPLCSDSLRWNHVLMTQANAKRHRRLWLFRTVITFRE